MERKDEHSWTLLESQVHGLEGFSQWETCFQVLPDWLWQDFHVTPKQVERNATVSGG